MRQTHNKRNPRADSCCKPCDVDAHPAGKYEKVIAKNIERAAGQHTQRDRPGLPSFRRNAANIWFNRNSGNAH